MPETYAGDLGAKADALRSGGFSEVVRWCLKLEMWRRYVSWRVDPVDGDGGYGGVGAVAGGHSGGPPPFHCLPYLMSALPIR